MIPPDTTAIPPLTWAGGNIAPVHVHVHVDGIADVLTALRTDFAALAAAQRADTAAITAALNDLQQKVATMSGTFSEKLDADLQAIADLKSVDDSIIALCQSLKSQLDQALATSGLTAEQMSKFDQISDFLTSERPRIAQAVTANTPSQVTPGGDPSVPPSDTTVPPEGGEPVQMPGDGEPSDGSTDNPNPDQSNPDQPQG